MRNTKDAKKAAKRMYQLLRQIERKNFTDIEDELIGIEQALDIISSNSN